MLAACTTVGDAGPEKAQKRLECAALFRGGVPTAGNGNGNL
jgi:hypothetical protein